MKCKNNNEPCPAKIFIGTYISKAGVYRIDAGSANTITVAPGVSAHIFDATSGVTGLERHIILSAGSELVVCGYVFDAEYSLKIGSEGENTKLNVAYLLASTEGNRVKSRLHTDVEHSHSDVHVHVVSFVGNEGSILIDGEIEVKSGVTSSKVYLREDNIFLGKTGKIRSIPTLNIRTDDVSAGHAARVERIPEEKLYYLLSRGLDIKKATTLLLESMVGSLFHRLKNISEALYEDLKLDILTSLSHQNEE